MKTIQKYWPLAAGLIYLIGLAMLPGWFYYRGCTFESVNDRGICTMYSSLFWPVALPAHMVGRGVIYSFGVWRL